MLNHDTKLQEAAKELETTLVLCDWFRGVTFCTVWNSKGATTKEFLNVTGRGRRPICVPREFRGYPVHYRSINAKVVYRVESTNP